MKIARIWILITAAVSLAVLLSMIGGLPVVRGQAEHVRWDLINLNFPTGNTVSAGGFAKASADAHLSITFSDSSGTFVSPGSGGSSHGVTGGGHWETFNDALSTGSGTFEVIEVVNWEFANFQSPGLIDLIADTTKRANGNAILRIRYSDGSDGILGVGCHGGGAPAGIQEGVIATKDHKTYWTAHPPVSGVNGNRTLFHVLK